MPRAFLAELRALPSSGATRTRRCGPGLRPRPLITIFPLTLAHEIASIADRLTGRAAEAVLLTLSSGGGAAEGRHPTQPDPANLCLLDAPPHFIPKLWCDSTSHPSPWSRRLARLFSRGAGEMSRGAVARRTRRLDRLDHLTTVRACSTQPVAQPPAVETVRAVYQASSQACKLTPRGKPASRISGAAGFNSPVGLGSCTTSSSTPEGDTRPPPSTT